jgi:hypothetical protein
MDGLAKHRAVLAALNVRRVAAFALICRLRAVPT